MSQMSIRVLKTVCASPSHYPFKISLCDSVFLSETQGLPDQQSSQLSGMGVCIGNSKKELDLESKGDMERLGMGKIYNIWAISFPFWFGIVVTH